ncbi:MAG TPA: TetR/AcrR family transcriptional regulator [Alphaproteobacteria bacterium]|nr:TetR/AcrR family transcriptional regulator [Alphaproteobacteria bacterium]
MTDPRVAKTRAALAQAVLELAAEKSFADITITEIAERAGVGYASFFRHYRDKDALLTDVADTMVDDLLAIIVPALRDEDTRSASIAICRYVESNRLITRALLAGGAETQVHRHIITRAIGDQQAPRASRTEVPREMIVTHAVAASLGLLSWWLEHGPDISAETMGDAIDRLVMAPVRQLQSGRTRR